MLYILLISNFIKRNIISKLFSSVPSSTIATHTIPAPDRQLNRSNKNYIIIIIVSFYIALKTSTMSLCALQVYSGLPAHNVCTFSTPWGAFQPGAILKDVHNAEQTTIIFHILSDTHYPKLPRFS